METLGDALPREMIRVMQVLKHYEEIGPAGQFGCIMINISLRAAERAIAEDDIVAMIRAYKDLKEIS